MEIKEEDLYKFYQKLSLEKLKDVLATKPGESYSTYAYAVAEKALKKENADNTVKYAALCPKCTQPVSREKSLCKKCAEALKYNL